MSERILTESLKARPRREREGFFDLYCKGLGIDIGCGDDPLNDTVDQWDLVHGDAHFMAGVENDTYDFVYSSHCLEHLEDPITAIQNWYRICKPGGYLIIAVPSRDHYERKKHLPSNWNEDHKTYWKLTECEPPCTWGLIPTVGLALKDVRYWQILDAGYKLEGWEPTPDDVHAPGEFQIEVVIQKLGSKLADIKPGWSRQTDAAKRLYTHATDLWRCKE